ncbi:nesprin-2-like [Boleophthalmus pectinirostris]|uniref:nesprin-2-like n=1 Tax=Boleophthalmus pectinirostris TaxID=150288 RepID=UPI00242A90D4|nr:nesprin-2-like [Boleophthalmus pectinirostris]
MDEVQQQWDDTRTALASRRQLYTGLMDSLKKFPSCRGVLTSTLQRAEQTISEQASYMGKDNLHKAITKVGEIKQELAGLTVPMEELKATCKQIQTSLKKIPDCNQTSFESEADSIVDTWLDLTEKTDSYMDNLKVALELWDKQLMLGSEVDSWAGAKLALFAASHPFHNEQQVFAMRDEINKNEENIEHFHRKSVEIQEMLQSRESPLELQVIETALRKRMEQVKELFTDCTDVFEELMAVKKHLTEKVEESQSAVENLQSQITKCDVTKPDAETQIQVHGTCVRSWTLRSCRLSRC